MSVSNLLLSRPPIANFAEPVAELRLKFLPASSKVEALTLWRSLEAELSNQRIACSSLWVDTWLNHYGSFIPHQFVIGLRGGIPCGMTLLTQGVQQCAGPLRLRTRHVGTAGEPEADSVCVEYNATLAAPQDRLEFDRAIWKWAIHETNCDEFHLDGFDSPSIEQFLTDYSSATVERKKAYWFDLSATRDAGEDPIMRLGAHTRGNIRRNLRILGDVRGEWADSTARAEQMFHELIKLHQARWNAEGLPGVYSSERFLNFHLDLLNRAIPRGMMAVFGVFTGQSMIGCCQMMIDDNRCLLYQCGRAPATGRASHGLALDFLCICEALRRGYNAVDFLAGDNDHKRRLSTCQAELAWAIWRRPSLKNKLIAAMRNLKRASDKFRCTNPAARASRMTSDEPAANAETKENLPS